MSELLILIFVILQIQLISGLVFVIWAFDRIEAKLAEIEDHLVKDTEDNSANGGQQ